MESERLKLYWFRDTNFGDALNESWLSYYQIDVEYSSLASADAVGIGSILNHVPGSFTGAILGAGFMWQRNAKRFEKADIRILRGRLTADRCNAASNVCLGDPGLLVRNFFQPATPKKFTLGLIPHFADRKNKSLTMFCDRYPDEVVTIDVRSGAPNVLTKISECQFIASSSLHGLVAADSFGISNIWLALGNKVLGNGFKFRDYFSAIDSIEKRDPFLLKGDESLSRLIKQAVSPDTSVDEAIARLDEELNRFGLCFKSGNRFRFGMKSSLEKLENAK